jgi:hypothetical protein
MRLMNKMRVLTKVELTNLRTWLRNPDDRCRINMGWVDQLLHTLDREKAKNKNLAAKAKKRKPRDTKKPAMKDRGNLPEEKRADYIKRAQMYYGDEGSCEIDDNALVSHTHDAGGAYVQSWVWVSD